MKSEIGGSGFFLSCLTLIFITLKLTHFINWSWWWVLAPMWIPIVIVLAILLLLGVTWLGVKIYVAKKRSVKDMFLGRR